MKRSSAILPAFLSLGALVGCDRGGVVEPGPQVSAMPRLVGATGLDSILWTQTDSIRILARLSDGSEIFDAVLPFASGRSPSLRVPTDRGVSVFVQGSDRIGSILWEGEARLPASDADLVATLGTDLPVGPPQPGNGLQGSLDSIRFSSPSGTFDRPISLDLSTSSLQARLVYTLDGSVPNLSSPRYVGSLELLAPTRIRARAYLAGHYPSALSEATYGFRASTTRSARTSIRPSGEAVIVLSSSTPGATIRYSLSDSVPTETSAIFADSLVVPAGTRWRARAFRAGFEAGPVVSDSFGLLVSNLRLDVASGTFADKIRVNVSGLVPGDTIRCTYDGSIPNATTPACSTVVVVDRSMQFGAKAFNPQGLSGPLVSATWSLKVAPVQLQGLVDSSDTPIWVKARTTTPQATIRFATNGAEVGPDSPVFPDSMRFDSATDLVVVAFRPGFEPSLPAPGFLRFGVDSIETSPRPGEVFQDRDSVVPRSGTEAAVLRCRTDGATADSTSPICPDHYPIDSLSPELVLSVHASVPGHPGIVPSILTPKRWTWIGGHFIDSRDGKRYGMVQLGNDVWMRESLNYDTLPGVGSWCFLDNPEECIRHGRLYAFAVAWAGDSACRAGGCDEKGQLARGICPEGWHLPTDENLRNLDLTPFPGWRVVPGFTPADLRGPGTGNNYYTGTVIWNDASTGALWGGSGTGPGFVWFPTETRVLFGGAYYTTSLSWVRCVRGR